MCEPISFTNNRLIPLIVNLSSESNFVKNEIAKAMTVAIPFFQVGDALSNFGVAIVRLTGRLLLAIRIKFISPESVSKDQIVCNFREAINSLLVTPSQSLRNYANIRLKSSCTENWELNKHFGHVYVINLTDRPGSKDPNKFKNKLESLVEHMNQIGGCEFERIAATYGRYDLPKSVWNRVDDNTLGCTGDQLDTCHMGQAGCLMSHYRAIKDANANYIKAQKELEVAQAQLSSAKTKQEIKEATLAVEVAQKRVKQYSSILIIEEDNRFGFLNKVSMQLPARPFLQGTAEVFKKVMSELPEDWGMLYLCSVDCGPDGSQWLKYKSPAHSEHLSRLQYGLLTNAVAINSKAYETILKALSKIDDPKAKFKPVDHEYALLHKTLKVFRPIKPLAYQAPGDSTITNDLTNEPWDGTWDRRTNTWV